MTKTPVMKKVPGAQSIFARRPLVGVIGGAKCGHEVEGLAFEVGRLIAAEGLVLVNGGLGGVMEASARGCREGGGLSIGILPGLDAAGANPYIDIAIPTGLGDMRNALIVRAAKVLIAIGGRYGTLSEVALGLKAKKPVIGIGTWDIEGVVRAATPAEALERALKCMEGRSRGK